MYTKLAYLEDISVSPDVCLADAGLCKLLVTTRVGASVWSLASMNPDVCLQGGVAPSQADYPRNIFSCFAVLGYFSSLFHSLFVFVSQFKR